VCLADIGRAADPVDATVEGTTPTKDAGGIDKRFGVTDVETPAANRVVAVLAWLL